MLALRKHADETYSEPTFLLLVLLASNFISTFLLEEFCFTSNILNKVKFPLLVFFFSSKQTSAVSFRGGPIFSLTQKLVAAAVQDRSLRVDLPDVPVFLFPFVLLNAQ